MKIKKKIQITKEFGFKVGFASFCASAFRHPISITRWKDKVLINYLRENFSNVIKKYKNSSNKNNAAPNTNAPIWSLWWQGEEQAPEIVKLCFSNIRKNCYSHTFNVITKKNFSDYVELPEYITKKVDAGMITLTHFSDIIRFYLLAHYGGMWIDSTVLTLDKIPEEIFSAPYFTVKRERNFYDSNVAQRRWTGFLQAAHKDSKLCGFAYEIMLEYWKTHTSLFDYVFLDYIIALAYEELPEFRIMFDSVPLNNPEIDSLQPLLNLPYDKKKFADLTKSTNFFKLTYKHKFVKNVSGSETFYGKLIESGF